MAERNEMKTGASRLEGRLARWLERAARRIPPVRRALEARVAQMSGEIGETLHPYTGLFAGYSALPAEGRSHEAILEEMEALHAREEAKWREGFVSGAVYNGDNRHIEFVNTVYALNSQSNPLHADVWPSTTKFEAEIVAMTAAMLGRAESGSDVCGAVTSGGTESILLAMKSYRDRARAERGITRPNVVAPVTAHVAFDKAAQYFGIKLLRTPVDEDGRALPEAMARAVNRNTIALVASTPNFPYGTIDPVAAIARIARERGVGLHVDACLGGFVLPWAARLGYDVPPFDFRVAGVTSMSADTHKYGYAPKGTSVVLYRDPEQRRYQFYTQADWPGGLYLSPTLMGSRPGALSAGAWATLVSFGEAGYLDATQRILTAAAYMRDSIAHMPDLEIIGNPLWILAFRSRTLDIYRVLDVMAQKGWSLNGLHRPPAAHLAVTLRHTQPGVAQRFVADLHAAVATVRAAPKSKGGMAPVYGLAGTLPLRGVVDDLLHRYLDQMYRVP